MINKVDLPSADIDRAIEQLVLHFDFEEEEILQISAKTGIGMDEIVPTIVDRIPAPSGDKDKPSRSFLFDARYVENRGI